MIYYFQSSITQKFRLNDDLSVKQWVQASIKRCCFLDYNRFKVVYLWSHIYKFAIISQNKTYIKPHFPQHPQKTGFWIYLIVMEAGGIAQQPLELEMDVGKHPRH